MQHHHHGDDDSTLYHDHDGPPDHDHHIDAYYDYWINADVKFGPAVHSALHRPEQQHGGDSSSANYGRWFDGPSSQTAVTE